MLLRRFKQRLADKKARVGVAGLGYVGLPLAAAFAGKGFAVTGMDVDPEKLAALRRGESYVLDVSSKTVKQIVSRGFFHVTGDYHAVSSLDAVLICVPTPLSKTKEPDISFVVNAARSISRHLKKGQLVVLESTTYPGTTEEVLAPILEESGLKAEKDFFLAFSPERVDPGNKEYDVVSIPKVVGGAGKLSAQAARALYGAVMSQVVVVSSAKAAEMAKLLENTFRSVNIGLINEVALLSQRLGVDIWEVIEAAKTKPFGFMPFYPGPGIGGHCLPIDPLYLSWKSRSHGFEAKMIELAQSINEEMPRHVVERIARLLNQKRIPLKKASVLLLGVAYKRDVDDIRESPALEVMKVLREEGAEVSYTDPFVPFLDFDSAPLRSRPLTPGLLKKQDAVLILTDHSRFDYEAVVRHAKLVLDTRNVLRRFGPDSKVFFL